ncbi:MAG: reverse transcriptase domain-containing protein [Bryobacteraceae bacterium]
MRSLILAFLKAGVMIGGLVSPVAEGTPQGGPLSPLLPNVVLNQFDRELERRGLRFGRYADDLEVSVRSRRACKPQQNPYALSAACRGGGWIHMVNSKFGNRLTVVPPGFSDQKKTVMACLFCPDGPVLDEPMSVHILSCVLGVSEVLPVNSERQWI